MASAKAKPNPRLIVGLLVAIALGLLLWYAHTAFEDRHWQEYRKAGQRAFERGNYKWAEKMHKKALREAKDLGPKDPRITKSLVDLSKVYKAQGRRGLADSARARARALRSR